MLSASYKQSNSIFFQSKNIDLNYFTNTKQKMQEKLQSVSFDTGSYNIIFLS